MSEYPCINCGRPTPDRCAECGGHICLQCAERWQYRSYCAPCAEEARASTPPPSIKITIHCSDMLEHEGPMDLPIGRTLQLPCGNCSVQFPDPDGTWQVVWGQAWLRLVAVR